MKLADIETGRTARTREDATLVMKSVQSKPDTFNHCNPCTNLAICKARVQLGLWLLCEYPDVADLQRLRLVFIRPSVVMLFPLDYLVKLRTRLLKIKRFRSMAGMIDSMIDLKQNL